MNSNFVEDIYILDSQGPVIRRDYEKKEFSVRFGTMEFLTSSRCSLRIVHEKYKTVGEANRGGLHDLLDRFIDELLEQ